MERFEANAEVIVRHGTGPPGDGNLFDARAVIEKPGPGIERPK